MFPLHFVFLNPVNSFLLQRPDLSSVSSPAYMFVPNEQVWLPEVCLLFRKGMLTYCCLYKLSERTFLWFFTLHKDKGTDIYRETVANNTNVSTTVYCLINATPSKQCSTYCILKCKTMRLAQYICLRVHSFRKYLKNINYFDSFPGTINVYFCNILLL